jgi:predicted metal-dependent hydrolase
LNISRTKIKEILKPYREKIHVLFMVGVQKEKGEQEKKDNLELYTYVEGYQHELVYKDFQGQTISPILGKRQIIISMKEELNYDNVYKELDKFYTNMAKKYLPMYFENHLSCFSYETKPELRIKKMLRQWGNCKKSVPVITLNSHLIKLPSSLINYIIFHELAHLIQANHSRRFYDIIEVRYPNRKKFDKELKLWSFVLRDNYIEEYPSEKSS